MKKKKKKVVGKKLVGYSKLSIRDKVVKKIYSRIKEISQTYSVKV